MKKDESLIIILFVKAKWSSQLGYEKKRKVKKEEWERENQAIVCIKEALT